MKFILRRNANDEYMVDILQKRRVLPTHTKPMYTVWATVQMDMFWHELRAADFDRGDIEVDLTIAGKEQ